MAHRWTGEQLEELARLYKEHTLTECCSLMNERFGLNLRYSQMIGAIKNNGILSGRDGRYKPWRTSWNKGKKRKPNKNSEATQFKPGHIPKNHRPIGSERISKDSYIEIKVAEPNKWRHKHRVVWESAHGEIPKGHVVLFLNQDKNDCRIENLRLISRKRLGIINKFGLLHENAELTKTGLLIAELRAKTYEVKKRQEELNHDESREHIRRKGCIPIDDPACTIVQDDWEEK